MIHCAEFERSPEQKLAEFAADAANHLSLFFINSKPTFINGPRSLPRNPPDCTILDC